MLPRPRYRLVRLLRPLAFLAMVKALIVAWTAYYDHKELRAALPPHMLVGDLLLPLYAVWRPPTAEMISAPMGRLAIDLWSSPIFDRFALAACVAGLSVALVAWASARRVWTPLCLAIAVLAVLMTNVFVARIPAADAGLIEPFSAARRSMEYRPDVPVVGDDPIGFIEAYPELNRTRRIGHHPGTHPPGGVLFLWLGERWFYTPPTPPPSSSRGIANPRAARFSFEELFGGRGAPSPRSAGLRGALRDDALDVAVWWAVGFTALGVVPAWWLARSVGGAAAARRVLPMYVVAPNLVLFGATSMDGVFLVVCLTALAAGVAAMRRWSRLWTPILTLVAGAALWLATFMTFTAIGVPIVMLGYALCAIPRQWRRGTMMLVRCVGVGVVFIACHAVAARALHYDLHATLDAAMKRDAGGVHTTGYESFPIWRDLSIGNAFAFLVGSGLAVTGLALTACAFSLIRDRLRGSGLASFTPAVMLAVSIMACSTLFTMEVERVWLFLTPAFLVVATAQFRGAFVWCALITLSLTQVFILETNYYLYW